MFLWKNDGYLLFGYKILACDFSVSREYRNKLSRVSRLQLAACTPAASLQPLADPLAKYSAWCLL